MAEGAGFAQLRPAPLRAAAGPPPGAARAPAADVPLHAPRRLAHRLRAAARVAAGVAGAEPARAQRGHSGYGRNGVSGGSGCVRSRFPGVLAGATGGGGEIFVAGCSMMAKVL